MNERTTFKDLQNCRVLVTATSFGRHDPTIKAALEAKVGEVIYNPTQRPLKSSECQDLIGEIDGWIAGLDEIDAAVMVRAKHLKVIARYGVGTDRVDLKAASQAGIVVTNTPGANSSAVAELAIGLMLALARSLTEADRSTRQGGWPRLSGLSLHGKSIGLIGFGSIGQAVASRLSGFNCRILAYDPYLTSERAQSFGVELVDLDSLVASADIVSLHLPVLPETVRMVNADFLSRMKPGSFLINTARGELVDEQALLAALESGQLRGAALDCFSTEPPGAEHPLFKFPQVIVTPHTGAHTDQAINQMGWMALEACLDVLEGRRPEYAVNPEIYRLEGERNHARTAA